MSSPTVGALSGIRIVELAGVGPVPFAAMLLADMGADIVTVDRLVPSGLGVKKEPRFDPTTRSRPSIAVDLKSPQGQAVVLRLVGQADALLEGFRPGVMERLGLGPEVCARHNPRLVFGRATGWGQEGPLANSVGHDLNYLAITGALAMIGPREGTPSIPLNLLGDYAGGGVYLALGVLAAILEAKRSGQGQVVDAAMVDGIESMMTHYFAYVASGRWKLRARSWCRTRKSPPRRHRWPATPDIAVRSENGVPARDSVFFCSLLPWGEGSGMRAIGAPRCARLTITTSPGASLSRSLSPMERNQGFRARRSRRSSC